MRRQRLGLGLVPGVLVLGEREVVAGEVEPEDVGLELESHAGVGQVGEGPALIVQQLEKIGSLCPQRLELALLILRRFHRHGAAGSQPLARQAPAVHR